VGIDGEIEDSSGGCSTQQGGLIGFCDSLDHMRQLN
jgi:hypothetical protein